VLKAKLDQACARLEADARVEAQEERAGYDQKVEAWEARNRRGPKPPDDAPPRSAAGGCFNPGNRHGISSVGKLVSRPGHN